MDIVLDLPKTFRKHIIGIVSGSNIPNLSRY